MPELPDLLYIRSHLKKHVEKRTITAVTVRQPIVLRVAINQPFDRAIANRTITNVDTRGPFINVELSDSLDLIFNLMLAGRLQHQHAGERAEGFLCCAFALDDASILNFCDQDKMAKLYLVPHGDYSSIPKYGEQGIDILSPLFTMDCFKQLASKHSRKQVDRKSVV